MERKKKSAILVISFGTSYQATREKTLDVIERELREAVAEYEFRRAYTSPTVIRILKERDGMIVDSVEEALNRLWRDGYPVVLAQSTHVIHGFEYDRMREVLARYQGKFEQLVYGESLLTEEIDYQEAVQSVGKELESYRQEGTDLIFLGHGTEHVANASYAKLQEKFWQEGYRDCLVGTVEGSALAENVEDLVQKRRSQRVVLIPFLVVAGEHVCRDIAGEQKDSWKSRFLRNGCQVECVFKGLGEYKGIRQIYIRHAREAEKKLLASPKAR